MADDDKGEKEERKPLRRRRAPSVVPDDAGVGEDTSETRRRLFSEPAAEPPAPEGVKKKRRWFRVASEPAPPSDLAETEARAEAAKAAATELRSRLKPAEEEPVAEEAPVEPAPRRRRGTTELAPPPLWQRHDLLVVALALLLFAGGALIHRVVAAPSLAPVGELGLQLARPASWLAGRVARPAAGLASAAGDDRPPAKRPRHLVYQSPVAPTARLELRISERPLTGNLKAALVLGRVSRYGEAFWSSESTSRTIGGRDWVRTHYRYAFKGTPTDAPIIATAIEYATLNGRLMYIVTVHGDEKTARRLESLLVPTLKVDANHPAAVGK
jgi:hypothetical protein